MKLKSERVITDEGDLFCADALAAGMEDTPLNYLRRTRVENAKRLLETTTETFDEICYRMGYENSNHFMEVFKKHTGLLPSEYQKKFHMQ